ncbi:MAG: DUF393 domain-containing protein [Planctomycetes bacterium]|nr:DUF393 domain-containing protein [Planctomycetota bacterium]
MATATAPTKTLPSPAERPDSDIVIYDGHCRICTGQIQRLARFDRGQRLSYLSLHDPVVAQRWPDLKYDDLMKNMLVIDRQGNRYWGASAVRFFSRHLPTLWWAAPVLHIPGSLPVWQWLYQQVAKRRYRFGRIESCDDGSCQLHR